MTKKEWIVSVQNENQNLSNTIYNLIYNSNISYIYLKLTYFNVLRSPTKFIISLYRFLKWLISCFGDNDEQGTVASTQ